MAVHPHPSTDPASTGPASTSRGLRSRTRLVSGAVGRGLLAGLVLGVAYRGWMRLVATDPSFSWEGTLGIVLVVTIVTLAASVCAAVQASSDRRWVRRLVRGVAAVLIVLGLGSPPATVTVPAFVVGGLAWARTDWSPRRRRHLALIALVLALASLSTPVFELGALPAWRATAAVAGYGILIVVPSGLFAIPAAGGRARPWAPVSPGPQPQRASG
jgi:hypothetical protein